ncbi:hypothetical protein [Luteibacter rhizovicinus]|uniref:hypothetical protein n=1 Tax=Luteibacter rhizovicinus TaxID=242606 RepID=UPI001048574F|nr:hypothetical protein [Luteibacter rhizovicinus]
MSKLAGRESIAPSELYKRFYADSGIDSELVIALLQHVADELCVPVDRLRPLDRFAVGLAPEPGNEWDSGHGILTMEMKSFARKRGRMVDVPILTLDDYIRFVAEVY